MATKKDTSSLITTDIATQTATAEATRVAAIEASYQIESLMEMMLTALDHGETDEGFPFAARSVAMRTVELSGVIMEALGDPKFTELGSLEQRVYGRRGAADLLVDRLDAADKTKEVSHG